MAFDLGSSDDLTRKNHGGRYGSFIFDAVTAFNRTVGAYHGHDALWNICRGLVRNIKTGMCDDKPPIFIISVKLGLEEAATFKLSGSDP